MASLISLHDGRPHLSAEINLFLPSLLLVVGFVTAVQSKLEHHTILVFGGTKQPSITCEISDISEFPSKRLLYLPKVWWHRPLSWYPFPPSYPHMPVHLFACAQVVCVPVHVCMYVNVCAHVLCSQRKVLLDIEL